MSSDVEKSPSEHSPTRVTDFDSSQYVADSAENTKVKNSSPILHLQPPSIEVTPSYRRKNRKNLMPTLEERSVSSTSEGGNDSRDEVNRRVPSARVLPTESPSNGRQRMIEAEKLTTTASNLASRGKETQALQRYHRALKMTRQSAVHAKRSLEDIPQATKSKREQLHDELFQLKRTIADICTNMAVLYERIGDYSGALSSCREAHSVYVKISKADKTYTVHSGRLSAMLNQLKKAGSTFERRRELHRAAIHSRKLISAVNDPSRKRKLYHDLKKTLNSALTMERESLGEAHPQVADTIGMLANIHVETNHTEKALEHFRAAVSILRLSLGPYHPKTGMGFKQLASLYDSRRKQPEDMDMALRYYGEAVVSFREAYGKHNALVGATLNNIAVIQIHQKDYEDAVNTLSDALASYENVAINNNGVHPNTAQIWRNLGQVYSLRGEWESAILAYASSLEVQREICRGTVASGDSLDDIHKKQSMADTLKKMGKAMSSVGRHEDAIGVYAEALNIHQGTVAVMKKHHAAGHVDHAELLVAQENVAQTMQSMGGVQESCGHLDEAMLIYVSTLMLRRQNASLTLSDGQDGDGVEAAMSMSGIGSVHLRKGEFEDACTVLEEALRIFKNNGLRDCHKAVVMTKQRLSEAQRGMSSPQSNPAVDSKPELKRVKKDNTLTLDAKARALVEDRDYDGAIRILTQVLVKRRQRLTKQQMASAASRVNVKEKDDVARTLGAFAQVLVKKGDFEQAQVLLEESLKLYRTNGVGEGDQRVQDAVSELKRLSVHV